MEVIRTGKVYSDIFELARALGMDEEEIREQKKIQEELRAGIQEENRKKAPGCRIGIYRKHR